MRILFAALHFGYFRNHESAIVRLAERGHEIVLTADIEDVLGGRAIAERMGARFPNVTFRFTPPLVAWPWTPLASGVRRSLELLRFFDPMYDKRPKYRNRAAVRSPRGVRRWAERAGARSARRAAAMRGFAAVERGIPPPAELCALLREIRPDVVLLASVTNDGAPQMDHLKAALHLGIPVALAVQSWDHLSGKALVHIPPDRLIVWNDTQRDEAVHLHGIDASRVVATGVPSYDQWFGRTPSRSREAFCRELGFDAGRPIVLYVCSVLSRPAPPEPPFVLEWIAALRRSADDRLRDANVLIRPHPERLYEWDAVDLSKLDRVVLRGRNPIDPDTQADYFDSLHHASAVVGIVTSAFLEAAVVGRPCLTVEEPRFREHQEGSAHYQYIRDPTQGLLLATFDLDAHVTQLGGVLADPFAAEARTKRFVERFVRPFGLDVVATDRFVDAVESMAGLRAGGRIGAVRDAAAAWIARTLIAVPGLRPLWWNEEEAWRQARPAEERRERAATQRRRQQWRDAENAERARREREAAKRSREKAARLREREQTAERKRRRATRVLVRARRKEQFRTARREVRQMFTRGRRRLGRRVAQALARRKEPYRKVRRTARQMFARGRLGLRRVLARVGIRLRGQSVGP